MQKILQKEEKVLRKIAKEVLITDIKTNKIKKILEEMSEALKSQNDGVAIAAPQIGYSLRIFLVSGKVFEPDFAKERESQLNATDQKEKFNLAVEPPSNSETLNFSQRSDLENSKRSDLGEKYPDQIFINPKITKLSREKNWLPEGCLSVRPLFGKTFRSTKATAIAYDENGKKITRGASGLLAQIFQHETDHLNGILFIDHAKEIKEEKPG
jgi:peptide deformylase